MEGQDRLPIGTLVNLDGHPGIVVFDHGKRGYTVTVARQTAADIAKIEAVLVANDIPIDELAREHVGRFEGIVEYQRHALAAQILTASIGLRGDGATVETAPEAPPEYLLAAPVEIDGLTLDGMRASLCNAVRALDAVSPSKAPLAQRLRELSQIQTELQRGALVIAIEMRRVLGGEGGA